MVPPILSAVALTVTSSIPKLSVLKRLEEKSSRDLVYQLSLLLCLETQAAENSVQTSWRG